MLICTYLVAIAGYLFPVQMPQKLWQLISMTAHPPSPPHSEVPRGQLSQGRQQGGPPLPALGVWPQLPVGSQNPRAWG